MIQGTPSDSIKKIKELINNWSKNILNFQTYDLARAVEFLQQAKNEIQELKNYYWSRREYDKRQIVFNLEAKVEVFLTLCSNSKKYTEPVKAFQYIKSIENITNIESKLRDVMAIENL